MHYVKSILKRICTLLYLILIKIFHIKQFAFKGISLIDSSSRFIFNDQGRISIGKGIGIRRNCEISVSENGNIKLDDNVFLNNGCMIVAHDLILVGGVHA